MLYRGQNDVEDMPYMSGLDSGGRSRSMENARGRGELMIPLREEEATGAGKKMWSGLKDTKNKCGG